MTRTLGWVSAFATVLACSSLGDPTEERSTSLGASRESVARRELLWTSRDFGQGLSWRDADMYCRGLSNRMGSAGWRLPSIDELESLFDSAMGHACGKAMVCRIDPAIHLSTPYQWSATAPSRDRRFYFDFSQGSQLSPLIRPSLSRGTLCVRRK